MQADAPLILHASCVALDGRGVLILGPSGSGKSTLALALMAFGAALVADDRTLITPRGAQLHATCPPALRGMIEARGLGLLNADPVEGVDLSLVVDMTAPEPDRLPPHRSATYFGRTVGLVQAQQSPHFPAALIAYVKGGRKG